MHSSERTMVQCLVLTVPSHMAPRHIDVYRYTDPG
jgi:hypothetical protein